jgi:hypothetical protein
VEGAEAGSKGGLKGRELRGFRTMKTTRMSWKIVCGEWLRNGFPGLQKCSFRQSGKNRILLLFKLFEFVLLFEAIVMPLSIAKTD